MWMKSSLRFVVLLFAYGMAMNGASAANIVCSLSPESAVIVSGQAVTLTAQCSGAPTPLTWVEWKMDGQSLTGVASVSQTQAGGPLSYTTPLRLVAGEVLKAHTFTMAGGDAPNGAADTNTYSAGPVTVTVSLDTAVAVTQTGQTGTLNGACGTANGGAAQAMPTTKAELCSSGNVALQITTPSSFSWSCLSPNEGADASCYAARGYTVTASVSGGHGTVGPTSQSVASGNPASVTATPVDSSYAPSFTTDCTSGSRSGNSYTTGAITKNCALTVTFNQNSSGACGTQNNTPTTQTLTASSPNLCSSGTATSFSTDAMSAKWTCQGTGTGQSPSCSAPMAYTVTAGGGDANGNSVNSASLSQTITAGQTATIAVTLAPGYSASLDPGSTCPAGSWPSLSSYKTGAITGPCTVTMTYSKQTNGISCNGVTQPGTVVEVATNEMAAVLPRAVYKPNNGDEVYAFKVTTPATGKLQMRFAATKLTDSYGGKRVVISSCRGDYNPVGKTPGCANLGSETTSVNAFYGYPTTQYDSNYYCALQPGQTYWVNVSSRESPPKVVNCTNSTQCKFYFEGN